MRDNSDDLHFRSYVFRRMGSACIGEEQLVDDDVYTNGNKWLLTSLSLAGKGQLYSLVMLMVYTIQVSSSLRVLVHWLYRR